MSEESVRAQLLAQQARVDQLRTLYNLRRQQVDQLRVRAGMTGVLEQVPVEVGQQVAQGTNVARVADPTRLKAELRIAETQARDLTIGQVASGRHPQRHHPRQGHPHRPGGAERHRHGRRRSSRASCRAAPGPT